MKLRYKLTQQNGTSYGGTRWTIGEWRETNGKGNLCGPGWLHCYRHILFADLHNQIHANIKCPRLWEVEVAGRNKNEGLLKEGWTKMRLLRELPYEPLSLVFTLNLVAIAQQAIVDEHKMKAKE